MKAIVQHEYGPADVLKLEEIEKPTPGDEEVLMKIRAASANPADYHLMSGAFIMRPMTGFLRPKHKTPGADLAGVVEAVGANVKRIHPGDMVFGAARGAFAEYACGLEKNLALKPASITFDQASSLPVAALTALQGLRDKAGLQRGQKVLINGAAGGVGTFAVQIAKSLGAEVTAVCSTRNIDLVRSIGADHAIDYTTRDFTQGAERYDVLLDCVGNRPVAACLRVLTKKGTLVSVGVKSDRGMTGILMRLMSVVVSSWFASQKVVFFVARLNTEDLTVLAEMVVAGKVNPVIDRKYELGEASEAIRYLRQGHARGKVVITVK